MFWVELLLFCSDSSPGRVDPADSEPLFHRTACQTAAGAVIWWDGSHYCAGARALMAGEELG